jgi:Caspase domain
MEASTIRMALFVGNDQGLPKEHKLQFASRDAREMAKVFKGLGSVDEDRVYLLENKKLDHIQDAFSEIRGRVKELKSEKHKLMFMFYYSGHGSKEALHISGQKWNREQFLKELETIPADLKMVVVDACESGSLLRNKGGRLITVAPTPEIDKLTQKGTIFLSSSAREELAQESNQYRGAIFSHHLINGLRGAADFNGNREISLWEAFHYASEATRSESIYGNTKQQNPGFDADFVGEDDVVLTSLHKGGSRIVFKNFPAQAIDLYDGNRYRIIGRIHLNGKEEITLDLPDMDYVLAYENKKSTYTSKVSLSWKKKVVVLPTDFQKFQTSAVISKGGDEISIHSLSTSAQWQTYTKSIFGNLQLLTLSFWKYKNFGAYQLFVKTGKGDFNHSFYKKENNLVQAGAGIEVPFYLSTYVLPYAGLNYGFGYNWGSKTERRSGFLPEGYQPEITEFSKYFQSIELITGLSVPLPLQTRFALGTGLVWNNYLPDFSWNDISPSAIPIVLRLGKNF